MLAKLHASKLKNIVPTYPGTVTVICYCYCTCTPVTGLRVAEACGDGVALALLAVVMVWHSLDLFWLGAVGGGRVQQQPFRSTPPYL